MLTVVCLLLPVCLLQQFVLKSVSSSRNISLQVSELKSYLEAVCDADAVGDVTLQDITMSHCAEYAVALINELSDACNCAYKVKNGVFSCMCIGLLHALTIGMVHTSYIYCCCMSLHLMFTPLSCVSFAGHDALSAGQYSCYCWYSWYCCIHHTSFDNV